LFIIIISQTQSVAASFLQNIKWELQFNPKIKFYYGNFYDPNRTWSKTRIETINNVCIQAAGAGQQIRGFQFMNQRPQIIILDDIESEKNSDTPDAREKIRNWISGAVMPSLDANNSRIIMIGTIIHSDSYLKRALDNPDWVSVSYPIINEAGESSWPDRFTKERIEMLRDKYSKAGMIHIFHREYMNEPIDPSQQPFPEEKIKWHTGRVVRLNGKSWIEVEGAKKRIAVYTGVDPAISMKGDFSAIVTIGMASDGIIYILNYVREHLRPSDLIDMIFSEHDKYKPELVTIESIAFQEALVDYMYKKMRETNNHFPITDIKPHIKKELRLQSLEPRFNSGSIYLREGMHELKRELTEFPRGATDDLMDGLWFAIENASPPKVLSYEEEEFLNNHPYIPRPSMNRNGINWLTGQRF